ncbi:MAG: roadblock/LC7 domain-containing protein [Methanomassiliicoccales archaeon]|nr:roadblock/LC7 domain-containing protein [Methanomassiliicoccales archaeon]
MRPAKSIESVLENIIREEMEKNPSIQNVFIISKTGLMIAGKSLSQIPSETFSAMIAIIYSSAESTKTENMKEKLEYVLAVFEKKKLFITEFNPNLLIVATVDREMDDLRVLDDLQRIVIRAKEELIWLR